MGSQKEAVTPVRKRGERKRRERRRKRILRFLKILLCIVIILGVLIFAFIFVFILKNVKVTGNEHYTEEEVLDALSYEEDGYHNTIIFYFTHRDASIETLPYIKEVQVKIGGIDTIKIEVTERTLLGGIANGEEYVYVDTEGYVCEISDELEEGVLLLEGIACESPQVNELLEVADSSIFGSIYDLLLLLEENGLTVSEVGFDENSLLHVQIDEITVVFGNFDSLEDKILEVNTLLPNLEGLSGTLHLENYDSSTDSIVFTKDS